MCERFCIFHKTNQSQRVSGIHLDRTVFAAIRGDELHITCRLRIPANESSSMFTCADPLQKQIYNSSIPATAGEPKSFARRVPLKNMQHSGEYSCRYKSAKVYWFLRLRGEHGKHQACSIGHCAFAQFLITASSFFNSRSWLRGAHYFRFHRMHRSRRLHWCVADFQCSWLSVCPQRILGKNQTVPH